MPLLVGCESALFAGIIASDRDGNPWKRCPILPRDEAFYLSYSALRGQVSAREHSNKHPTAKEAQITVYAAARRLVLVAERNRTPSPSGPVPTGVPSAD